MPTLSSDILKFLASADKYTFDPHPRDFLRRAPKRAVMIVVDGVNRDTFARARTPTFDTLAARGVSATNAFTIFPTITGPAHTSILTGARMQGHGFVYPKLPVNGAWKDFEEGFMHAETVAEAWRFRGLVSVGIGSRFLRGADAMVNEGVFGHDVERITALALQSLREFDPHFLYVVYYAADTMCHWYGPDSQETLTAIEMIDAASARILREVNLDETAVVVLADHGQMAVSKDAPELKGLAEPAGFNCTGRVAWSSQPITHSPNLPTLLNHPTVDTIYDEPELDLLGANHPNWGKSVIALKEDYWFSDGRPLLSYHGAWHETERHMPLILSGAGIRAGARLETCETVDLAPTLSLLLGGDMPRHADGRVLWEVLDAERAPSVEEYTRLIHAREELLNAWKQLKREYAGQSIRREEYLTRETELKRASAANIAGRREEGERLRRAGG